MRKGQEINWVDFAFGWKLESFVCEEKVSFGENYLKVRQEKLFIS